MYKFVSRLWRISVSRTSRKIKKWGKYWCVEKEQDERQKSEGWMRINSKQTSFRTFRRYNLSGKMCALTDLGVHVNVGCGDGCWLTESRLVGNFFLELFFGGISIIVVMAGYNESIQRGISTPWSSQLVVHRLLRRFLLRQHKPGWLRHRWPWHLQSDKVKLYEYRKRCKC